jgi:uncharacterized membrane protein YccC
MATFHVKHLLLAALLGACVAPASAQKMYRCPGAGGSTTFSDTPCANTAQEINVKPASGTAKAANASDAPSSKLADRDQRSKEIEAALSSYCRRTYQQYRGLAETRSGMDANHPTAKAWASCEPEIKQIIAAAQAKDKAAADALQTKRREQEAANEKKRSCDAKREVVVARNARAAQMSEQDRAALKAFEQDVNTQCRLP